jgi:hypothetical protein
MAGKSLLICTLLCSLAKHNRTVCDYECRRLEPERHPAHAQVLQFFCCALRCSGLDLREPIVQPSVQYAFWA